MEESLCGGAGWSRSNDSFCVHLFCRSERSCGQGREKPSSQPEDPVVVTPEDFFEEGKLYRFTELWRDEEEHVPQIWRDPYLRVVFVPIDRVMMFLHLYARFRPGDDARNMYAWFLVEDKILGHIMPGKLLCETMFERATK